MVEKNSFKTFFLIAIIIFILHGLEEYATQFYTIDKSYLITIGSISTTGSTFLIYQFVLWALLGLAYILIVRGKWSKVLSVVVGLILLFESQHLYEVALTGKYYPGAYTAILFPIIAFFFWKELLKSYKKI